MIKYEITDPCTENWDKMKQVPGGRFCDKCVKKVHDLTNGNVLPDSNESFCGRIPVEKTRSISFRKFLFRQSPLRYFALMFVLLVSNKIKAQLNKMNFDGLQLNRESEYEDDNIVSVSGTLLNEEKKLEVEGAFVTLYDSKRNKLTVTKTDSTGRFTFLIWRQKIADSLFSLKAEYIGLQTLELNDIPVTKKKIELLVKLTERESLIDVTTMVGMAVKTVTCPMYETDAIKDSDYRHTPNKDLNQIVKILSNAPVMGR